MKEHNIDQLFRQKLQQHTVTPTPAAWDKVTAGLKTRRRNRGGYYAAAAVVLLLLSAGWLGLQQYDKGVFDQQSTVAVSEQDIPVRPKASPEPAQTTVVTEEPSVDAEVKSETAASKVLQTPQGINALASAKDQKPAAKANAKPISRDQEPDASYQLEATQAETALAAQTLPDLTSQQAELDLNQSQISLPAADLALASSEAVIIRYDASQTEDDERDSAPEKVLSIFQKVKHGEIGLADIRQAKDNLLSGKFNKP